MKKTKLKQRVETLTECIKSLEKMKSTNESVIVITDSFICTSMAKRTDLNLTMLLLPILIEVAKKEGIEIKEIPKEALEKREQILN